MKAHSGEKWVQLYHAALLEVQHSLMSGRILEARTEIASRLEKLKDVPGLRSTEHHAIDDSLRMLSMLEREEARHETEQKRVAQAVIDNLKSVEPAIRRIGSYVEER